MNWIKIEDKLPEHHQIVLARSHKGFCCVVFVDSKKMNETLLKTAYSNECVDIDHNPYYFVSQEIKRNTLNGVTHWMDLIEPID